VALLFPNARTSFLHDFFSQTTIRPRHTSASGMALPQTLQQGTTRFFFPFGIYLPLLCATSLYDWISRQTSSELNIIPFRANLGVNWHVLTSHWASASGIWRMPMTSAHVSQT
jgi:hypothetical protein